MPTPQPAPRPQPDDDRELQVAIEQAAFLLDHGCYITDRQCHLCRRFARLIVLFGTTFQESSLDPQVIGGLLTFLFDNRSRCQHPKCYGKACKVWAAFREVLVVEGFA